MGLFDFVKDIGRKLFNRDEEAAEKIKQHIEEANPGISGLGVEFKDGVVSISGQASSAEAMEKAVLMAGNVQGVTEVKIDKLQALPSCSSQSGVLRHQERRHAVSNSQTVLWQSERLS